MEKSEKIWVASCAIEEFMDFQTLKDCDYMYGNEDETESVYEYVKECKEIGSKAWREKYKEFKLDPD